MSDVKDILFNIKPFHFLLKLYMQIVLLEQQLIQIQIRIPGDSANTSAPASAGRQQRSSELSG